MMQSRNKLIAYIGLFTACGILFGYVEYLLPLPIGIPGVKIGLSNIITVCSIYLLGAAPAGIVLILRVLLSGLLFGNTYSMLYGLAGGIAAFLVMLLSYRFNWFSILGLSAAGGVFHNIGQLAVAAFTISSLNLFYYLPILLISGILSGLAVGFLSQIIIKRLIRVMTRDDI